MSRVITADAIPKVSHHNFDIEKLIVYPKHVTLPKNVNRRKIILGLESIERSFKVNL